MTGVRSHSEWNKRVNDFVTSGTVACPDCGEPLPAGNDYAREVHYARCNKNNHPLSDAELLRLSELEVTIQRGLKVFYEVGTALLEVRDARLYRQAHENFHEYCQQRWQMSKTQANRLIQASAVVESLTPIGVIPANEAQAREYNGLEPDEQKALAALSQAVLGDKPTASGIRSLKTLSQELLSTGAITVDGNSVTLNQVLDYSLSEEQHERMERWKQNVSDAKAYRRAHKVATINAQELPTLDTLPRRFAVVYADPPWRYEHSVSDARAIENQYPTMETDAICALPVAGICTDDAVLFLWATSPKLTDAMQVVSAWGFTYRTCMVWDKARIGMGYYARQQHELLLIATRGDMPTPEPAVRPASVIRIERSETHSAKPPEFRSLIERMYPDFQRIELFAREVPEHWHAWGNEACGDGEEAHDNAQL